MKWLAPLLLIIVAAVFVRTADEDSWATLKNRVAELGTVFTDRDSDQDDDDDHPSRLTMVDGYLGLRLTPQEQTAAGVKLSVPTPWNYRHELRTIAEVKDISPLLELKARFRQLDSELAQAGITLSHARENYERLELLHADEANISARQLQDARMQLHSAETGVHSLREAISILRMQGRQAWGEYLMSELLNNGSEVFSRLQSYEDVLLYVPLRYQQGLSEPVETIYVAQDDNRSSAHEARLLSAAMETDPLLQGKSYYYVTAADQLRTGMRLNAWLPNGISVVEGVLIPANAVVWQGGSPWIYIQHQQDFFYRIALPDAVRLGKGWFVPADRISAGQQIVVTGAQMLLSEEYRWQIPDEDDDP